jgi:hypothetical protein
MSVSSSTPGSAHLRSRISRLVPRFLCFLLLFTTIAMPSQVGARDTSGGAPVSTATGSLAPDGDIQPSVGKEDTDQMRPPTVRGVAGDFWSDTVLGQPDFASVAPRQTSAEALFWDGGAIIDRTANPNRLYVYDSGNNRIVVITDTQACLNLSGYCQANLVIGQPNMSSSGCNRDSGYGNYPLRARAAADTLCGQPEAVLSVTEGGSGASMDIDGDGNLYVADYYNQRVLKYNSPSTLDQAADQVWGQADMSGNYCNRQTPYFTNPPSPTNKSLCFSWGNGTHTNSIVAGVDVDPWNNLWVADTANNRVIRFPYNTTTQTISDTADIVLGQPNFTSAIPRVVDPDPTVDRHRFADVVVVRVNAQGWVYTSERGDQDDPVFDDSDRVLIFKPTGSPPYNQASYGSDPAGELFVRGDEPSHPFIAPSGIEFDPDSNRPGVWIMNSGLHVVERWEETLNKYGEHDLLERFGTIGDGSILGGASGSFGIDSNGNRYVTPGTGNHKHAVTVFNPSGSIVKDLFPPSDRGNTQSNDAMSSVGALAVVGEQVIAADEGRVLVWNNRTQLLTPGYNGDAPDFVLNVTGCCQAMMADKANHLYVTVVESSGGDKIKVYNLPLTSTSTAFKTLAWPFNLLGSTEVLKNTGPWQAFFGVVPTANSEFLWISHKESSRVFRLRDPLGSDPRVDIVLGQTDPYGLTRNRQFVTWVPAANLTITGNTIEKTSGGSGWNAGTRSTNQFYRDIMRGDGAVSVRVQNTLDVAFGLNAVDTSLSYTDINAAFVLEGGHLKICEEGNCVADFGANSFTVGDTLTIQVVPNANNTVQYWQNNNIIYTSSIDWYVQTGQLFLDTSFRQVGARLSYATLGGVYTPALETTLNFPGAIALDRMGNLFLSDHSIEFEGNHRLLEFNSSLFPTNNTNVIYTASPSKIFPDVAGMQMSFNSQNMMVMPYNPYMGNSDFSDKDNNVRFPGIYVDPLSAYSYPDAHVYDYHSIGFASAFDSEDNMYLGDANRGRLLIYKQPRYGRPIRWTNPYNVTITGNSLEKTSGGTYVWDADAQSDQKLIWGDGYVEVKVDATNVGRHFGFNLANQNHSYTDIDYSMSMEAGATLAIYESGSWRADVGPYSVGDWLRVAVDGGVVKYYRTHAGQTTLLYTSNTLPSYPLMVDTSFYVTGAKITDAYIAGMNRGNVVQFTSPTNVTVTGNTIEKTQGVNGSADAGALSLRSIQSGDGYVQVTADATNKDRFFGLGNDPLTHYNNIRYALRMRDNGTLAIYESGALQLEVGTYSVGDTLRVAILNGQAKYYRNNRLLWLHGVSPTYPLHFDSSILSSNGRITNIVLSGNNAGDVRWIAPANVSVYGNTIGKSSGVDMQWDAGAISDRAIGQGTGYVEITVDACNNTARHFGLNSNNLNNSYTDIDYSLSLEAGCTLAIYENGTWRADVGAYAAGDVLKVVVEPIFTTYRVRYYRVNGNTTTLLYTSTVTPTFPLHLDTSIRTLGGRITNAFIYGDNLTK